MNGQPLIPPEMIGPEMRPSFGERVVNGFRNTIKGISVGVGGVATAYLVYSVLSLAFDPTSDSAEYDGEAKNMHVGEFNYWPIAENINVLAGGNAVQDTALTPDSSADEDGVFIQDIEYMPDGLLQLESVVDDDLGFFIRISENVDGETRDFHYEDVRIATPYPVHCNATINNDEGTFDPDDDCIRLLNHVGEWRGLVHSVFTKGGWFGTRLDNTPPTKARQMTDLMLDNTRCHYGYRFGTDDDFIVWSDSRDRYVINPEEATATAATAYDGVREEMIARLRVEIARMTGLTMTKTNGMPVAITLDQEEVLRRVAAKTGPLDNLTETEYRNAVSLQLIQEGRVVPEGSTGRLNFNKPLSARLLELQQSNPDIRVTDFTSDDSWAEPNGDPFSFAPNIGCLPLDSEGLGDLRRHRIIAERIAGLETMSANVEIVEIREEEEDDSSMSEIELFSGGETPFANVLERSIDPLITDKKIAVHKYIYKLPLSDADVALLVEMGVAEQNE